MCTHFTFLMGMNVEKKNLVLPYDFLRLNISVEYSTDHVVFVVVAAAVFCRVDSTWPNKNTGPFRLQNPDCRGNGHVFHTLWPQTVVQ